MNLLTLRHISEIHPLPGIGLWKKDKNSLLVDFNHEFSALFNIKNKNELVGKSDFDLPLSSYVIAEDFQKADRKVLESGKVHRFLEIYSTKNNISRTLFTVKSPWVIDHEMIGTLGYCIEIPSSLFQLYKTTDTNAHCTFSISNFHNLLSKRENECLFFILRGYTAKRIADCLQLSVRTIEEYISSIKNKLNCKSKNELISYCYDNNLLYMLPDSLLNKPLCVSL